jgi:hypothetical protein
MTSNAQAERVNPVKVNSGPSVLDTGLVQVIEVQNIITRMSVIDGVWIDNRIYSTLKHRTRDYALQITITRRLVFRSRSSLLCLLIFQQWTFLCFRGTRPRRLAAISHQPPIFLTVVSKLSRNQVKVTLRLKVSQSVCLGVEPWLGMLLLNESLPR